MYKYFLIAFMFFSVVAGAFGEDKNQYIELLLALSTAEQEEQLPVLPEAHDEAMQRLKKYADLRRTNLRLLAKLESKNMPEASTKEFVTDILATRRQLFGQTPVMRALSAGKHNDALLTTANNWLKFFASKKEDKNAAILQKELGNMIELGQITYHYISLLGPRYVHSSKTLGDGEKELLKAVIHESGYDYFEALSDENLWKNPTAFSTAWNGFHFKGYGIAQSHKERSHVGDFINYKVEPYLPESMDICVPGAGYFPLFDLVFYTFKDCHLLGTPAPDENLTAHGLKNFSPLAFCIHDKVHAELDSARRGAVAALTEHNFQNRRDGALSPTLTEQDAALVVLSYYMSMDLFLHILLKAQLEALDEEEKSKAILGLFLATHEFPIWHPMVFDIRASAMEFANSLVIGALSALGSNSIWEDSAELLETSPHDGSCALSDQQILEKLGFLEEDLNSSLIKRTKRFINVQVSTKRGSERTVIIPTLFHKYRNALDSCKLLEMGNINIEPPAQLTRVRAIKFIDEVRAQMVAVLEILRKSAARYLEEGEFMFKGQGQARINSQEQAPR
jgi:hypothetical protein